MLWSTARDGQSLSGDEGWAGDSLPPPYPMKQFTVNSTTHQWTVWSCFENFLLHVYGTMYGRYRLNTLRLHIDLLFGALKLGENVTQHPKANVSAEASLGWESDVYFYQHVCSFSRNLFSENCVTYCWEIHAVCLWVYILRFALHKNNWRTNCILRLCCDLLCTIA